MGGRPHRAFAMVGWLIAAGACDEPTVEEILCPVRGHHGAGGFHGDDCAGTDECLDTKPIAAGATTRVQFCPYGAGEVTEVTSSDPAVLRVDGWTPFHVTRRNIDLTAGVPGTAFLEVRGPGLDERVELTVEATASVTLERPWHAVAGGTVGVGGEKLGTSGRTLIGRGGYDLSTEPALLMVQRADPDDWCRRSSDFYVGTDLLGSYTVTTEPAALGGTATVEVVPIGAVTQLRLISRGGILPFDGRFSASIWVWTGGVQGVRCEWQTTRPVEVRPSVCGATLLMDTDEPFEAICRIGGWEWGRVQVYVEEQAR